MATLRELSEVREKLGFKETDHQLLNFLQQAKTENSRLMRWALLLQPFRFRIEAIKGKENVGADYLNRV